MRCLSLVLQENVKLDSPNCSQALEKGLCLLSGKYSNRNDLLHNCMGGSVSQK